MIIKSSRSSMKTATTDKPPVQKIAAPTPVVNKSERPQPKTKSFKKSQSKPVEKTESQVEENRIETKKRSLLEEILEEQANLED